MKSKDAIVTVLLAIAALAGGIFVGYADSRSDDPAITLLVLAAFTFVLGALGPRRPWLWPLLVGIWVPLLDIVLPRLGLVPRDTAASPSTILSMLAVLGVVMAAFFAGSYAGAFLVRAARRAMSPKHS